jgi:hypothetical protein
LAKAAGLEEYLIETLRPLENMRGFATQPSSQISPQPNFTAYPNWIKIKNPDFVRRKNYRTYSGGQ